jgi:hypothetical protein
VVAQPLRRAETLAIFWFLCGPFAARGAKGEAEYLSRWLGGTGEHSAVGKQDAARSAGRGTRRGTSIRRKGRTGTGTPFYFNGRGNGYLVVWNFLILTL